MAIIDGQGRWGVDTMPFGVQVPGAFVRPILDREHQ